MIVVKDLVKRYGGHNVVDKLNFEVADGCIFGMVGPNGAGKSTTIKMVSGLLAATSGNVIVNDMDVAVNPKLLKEKIGYMPDYFGVYDNLKVVEYMDFYAGAYYIPRGERKAVIRNLLDLVGLVERENEYVDVLSRGMKQRLCLARSLVHDPEVLLLDEPASGLDPRARTDMKEILKQLKSLGKTIIISSHILTELAELCTEVGIMDKGRMVVQGSIHDIMRTINKTRIIQLKPLSDAERIVLALKENVHVGRVTENVDDIEFEFDGENAEVSRLMKELFMKGFAIVAFKEKEGSLEEIFMNLTRGGGQDDKSGIEA